MNFASIRFFVSEALLNFRRAGLMTIVTISTIAIALVLMGAFLMATLSMETFLSRLQEEALVTAFLAPGTPYEGVQAVKLQITGFDEVTDLQVITPEQAARDLFSDPEDQKLLQIGIAKDSNPLPHTIRLRIRSSHDLDALVAKLKAIPQIADVSYGEEAFRRFQGLTELIWIGSLIVIVLLGLASLFIVFNTVRLTLFLRRDEIIIMKLVGATNWFIRWPFIIEGSLQGILGAIFALVILFAGQKFILARLAIIPFFNFALTGAALAKLAIKLFLMGTVLGVSGSLLSLRDLDSFSRSEPH